MSEAILRYTQKFTCVYSHGTMQSFALKGKEHGDWKQKLLFELFSSGFCNILYVQDELSFNEVNNEVVCTLKNIFLYYNVINMQNVLFHLK